MMEHDCREWLSIPAGEHVVGISSEELESFVGELSESVVRRIGRLPFALSSAVPARKIVLSAFQVSRSPVSALEVLSLDLVNRVEGIEVIDGFEHATFRSREAAIEVANLLGDGLITDAQWEVAQRLTGKLLISDCDEWCRDYFDGAWRRYMPEENPCLDDPPLLPVGCPTGRFTIRGDGYRGLAFHPAMRWHSPPEGFYTEKMIVRVLRMS